MSRRAEAVHGAVLDPAGEVVLRRDGVGVAGEQDERLAGAASRRAPTRRRRRRARAARLPSTYVRTIAASSRDGEAMSTSASVRAARSVRDRPQAGIIAAMIPRRRIPAHGARARASSSPCWRRAPTRTRSWPRSRSWRAPRASSRSAASSSTGARPAQRTYVGKGKLEELKERFASVEAEMPARRRRARPGAAALPRERARRARRSTARS